MRKLIFGALVFCLSFGTSFGQSSSTKNWNVHDCRQAPSACVDKTHLKEAYGTSLSSDGQTWAPSVVVTENSERVINTTVTIIVTMTDGRNSTSRKYQFFIGIGGGIINSRWYTMVEINHCNRLYRSWCYDWKLQDGKVPAEIMVKFKPAFQELAKQDRIFTSFF